MVVMIKDNVKLVPLALSQKMILNPQTLTCVYPLENNF